MQSHRGPNPRSRVHQVAQVSNPSDLPILIIHSTLQSRLFAYHQHSKEGEGEGEGGGGKVPPPPPAGSFLVRGKASNEGPTDAAELVVSAWEPRGAAGRASLLPISTQVLHQSARLLPGAEARGTALLTVGGGHGSLAGPGPCTLPFCGECKAPNPLTHSHPLQSASSGQTPSPPGDTLMKMADINLFPLPTGQFIVPWGDLALGQRA